MTEIDYNQRIQFCLARKDFLNDWEKEFIDDLANMDEDAPLSTGPGSQTEKLDEIFEKLI